MARGTIYIAFFATFVILCQGGAVKLSTGKAPKVHTDHDGSLCPYKADIALLMDASSSIGPADYQRMKEFLRGVVQYFDVGEDDVRIGLVTFNFGAKVEFFLNTHFTKDAVLKAFDSIQNVTMGTATHRALKYAREQVFQTENGDRPDVPNIAILLTDGRSTHPNQTDSEQALLKATGARIFAIGIGWIDETELRLVASDPIDKYYHYAKDFDGLDSILADFQQTSCAEITRPPPTTPVPTTTTTLPTTTTTETPCPYGADVFLLMDASSSIGSDNYQQMKDFLEGVIGHFQIGADSVQVGVITYNHGARVEFYLNNYTTKAEVLQAFDNIRPDTAIGTTTHAALYQARVSGFVPENGDRPDLPNIAILITDGRSTNPNRTATEQALLKEAGARIFAIGIAWTDEEELRLIASDPDEKYFHYVKTFDGLGDILGDFQQTSCNEITRPQPVLPQMTTRSPVLPSDLCLSKGDVVFVLDISSSVGVDGLEVEKNFVISILQEFDVGLDGVRVAVITFNQFPKVVFALDTYNNREDVIAALGSITEIAYGTNTHSALATLRTNVFGSVSDRPDVKNVAIVVTDGRSRIPSDTRTEAIALKATGAEVFAIGVGNVDKDEIDTISSDPNEHYSFYVDDFNALAAIKDAVVDKTCDYCHVADMIIVMDASSSIGDNDYELMKSFVKDFLQFFVLGDQRVRVGLITFNQFPHIEFQLNSHFSHASIFNAIDNLKPTAVGTWTDRALKTAREVMLTEANGARPGSPKIVVTLTDGYSREPNATIAEADMLKQQGTTMFSIGIGQWISETELKVLASRDDYVFMVADFNGLATIEQQLQRKTCNATATPWPVGCNAIGDFVFVFDSSREVTPHNFQLAKDFAAELVKDLRIGKDKARIGAVKFHDDASLEFPLDSSFDKSEILNSLKNIQHIGSGSREDKAFKELRNVAFKDCMGSRESVPDVAIFLTDGNVQDPIETAHEAILAANTGTRVYSVVIGHQAVPDGLLGEATSGYVSYQGANQVQLGKVRSQLLTEICKDYSPCD